MATPISDRMMADEPVRVFRSLGTKSARRDLSRKQPKTASDLDGVGAPEPVYQQGPDELDTELLRIYEGVDPAQKELEKLRAEVREAAIEKRKVRNIYTAEEDEADVARYARDATRARIGAKADNFSEALARSARVASARKANEQNKPEPVMGGSVLPEPPDAMFGGGLVDDGTIGPDYKDARTEDRRVRDEFAQLQDIYITRGTDKNVNPDGTPMSFRQYVAAEMQARPDSSLAQSFAAGRADKFFSPAKDRFDDQFTQEEAKRAQYRADATETRRRAMLASRDGGLGVIADYQRRYDNALETIRLKQEQGSAGPEDFLALANAQQALAGGYMSASQLVPGRGYDAMAAQMMISANRNNAMAGQMMETRDTNTSMERIAAAQNAQPPAPTARDQLMAAVNSPVREVEEQALAVPLAGENPTDKSRASALNAVKTATAGLAAEQAAQALAASNAVIQPGSPQWDAMSQFAALVDEQRFVSTLLPKLDDPSADAATRAAKQKRDNNYLLQLYRAARPQRYGLFGSIGNAFNNMGGYFVQPENPQAPATR